MKIGVDLGTDKEVKDFIKQSDKNGDGTISFEEYKQCNVC